jgi:hypothetical protein
MATETTRIGSWTVAVERAPDGRLDLDNIRVTTASGLPLVLGVGLDALLVDAVREALGDTPRREGV